MPKNAEPDRHQHCFPIVYQFDITSANAGRQCDNTHICILTVATEDYMRPNALVSPGKLAHLWLIGPLHLVGGALRIPSGSC